MLSFGLVFYWCSWLILIIVTFFMKSRHDQQLLIIAILMMIIFANQYYTIGYYQFSLAYCMILFGSCLMYRILTQQYYHLIVSFTLMIGYSGMMIWKSMTPLWLFVPDLLLVPLFCSFFVFTLAKGLQARLLTGLLGLSAGELLYCLIFLSYDIQLVIGDLSFLDQLLLTILIILLLHFVQRVIFLSYQLLNEYKNKLSLPKVHGVRK